MRRSFRRKVMFRQSNKSKSRLKVNSFKSKNFSKLIKLFRKRKERTLNRSFPNCVPSCTFQLSIRYAVWWLQKGIKGSKWHGKPECSLRNSLKS